MTVKERRKVVTSVAGIVVEVLVTVGSPVGEETEVAIVESMKMEIPVEAGIAGTVAEVLVAPGDKVAEGQTIAVLS